METPAGRVPRISTSLTWGDRLGGWRVRWCIGRMEYLVPPGLYALGSPGPGDPVVVTANYKMSYDHVRRALAGRNAWLLVLETYGVNVWCAAGKGSFGTDELVRRIGMSRLAAVVDHRRLLLPIMGASGVAAHEIARQTGFTVRYAALRADDLPGYLDNGMVTTPEMRTLTFTLTERLVLMPVELVLASRWLAAIGGTIFLLFFLVSGVAGATVALIAYLGAALAGIVAVPLLLPWLPGRRFSVKGGTAGVIWVAVWYLLADGARWGAPLTAAAVLALPGISAFHALTFTGCTPFTSRTGVKKELRGALPVLGAAIAAGLLLAVAALFT